MHGLRHLSGVVMLLVVGAFSKLALAENGDSSLLGQTSLPTASAVLKAIAAAPTLVDYEGTKVITAVREGRVETITVLESHKRPGSLRLEYLSPESVSGRLIIDDGTTLWQYEPSLHAVVQGPSFANKAIDATLLAEGLGHYAVTVEGTE
jgi:outer membrane lipoprotein-sorting protein